MNKKNKIFPPNKHLGAKIQVKANKTGEGKEDEGENSTRRELEENKHCNKYLGTQKLNATKLTKLTVVKIISYIAKSQRLSQFVWSC